MHTYLMVVSDTPPHPRFCPLIPTLGAASHSFSSLQVGSANEKSHLMAWVETGKGGPCPLKGKTQTGFWSLDLIS